MAEQEVLETGVYCTNCGYFEEATEIADGQCMGCGCAEGLHRKAQLVAVD